MQEGSLFSTPAFIVCRFSDDAHSNPCEVIPHCSFLKIYIFIYLSLASLGLCCCAQASSNPGERELLFVVVRGLLTAVASLVAEHRL